MQGIAPKVFEDASHGTSTSMKVALRAIHWFILLSVAMLGCTSADETVTLDVYSWWQEQSEEAAFEAVRSIHHDKARNVEVRNLGNTNAPDTRKLMAARLLAGAPPASFQANLGADMLRWTVVDTQNDPKHVLTDPVKSYRLIQGLSALYERTGLRAKLWDGLFENLVVGMGSNTPYAVPINVHRLNVLYYRPDALAEFGARPGNAGKSFLDFDTLCPRRPYDPDDPALALDLGIAVGGGKQPWTLALMTFENVLPAVVARRNGGDSVATRAFYEALFRGEKPGPRDESGASADVREAFECVQYLARWFQRTRAPEIGFKWDPTVGWAEAVAAVKDGAAFTIMGDWANGLLPGELAAEGGGASVVSQEFPGTRNLFVYTSDTFPLPLGIEHGAEAEALLETIASEDAQLAFSERKGSIPALEHARLERLHPWQRAAAGAFRTSERLLATSGYFPPYYPENELNEALKQMTEWDVVRPNADASALENRKNRLERALRLFTDAEPILAFWQARLERGEANGTLP